MTKKKRKDPEGSFPCSPVGLLGGAADEDTTDDHDGTVHGNDNSGLTAGHGVGSVIVVVAVGVLIVGHGLLLWSCF